jgi:hypothetical protein
MTGGPIRLRNRRVVRARRSSGYWRLPVAGGVFAVLVSAACWAPLAPTALAPAAPSDSSVPNAVLADAGAGSTRLGVAIAPAVSVPTPTLAPRAVPPTPVVVPTLSANGQSVLDSVRADRAAHWVKNHTETPLRSGPADTAAVFTQLPQWTVLKQIDSRPDWLLVQYSGDGDTRQPGPGWVKASDVGAVGTPPIWLTSAKPGTVWSTADAAARRIVDIPLGTRLEVVSTADFIQRTRVKVRSPGNGRTVPPVEGWVDGDVVARAVTPAPGDLPWAYPDDLRADVRINVPYRTQLDGSDFAGANCGPTVLGMALESFGVNMPPPELRSEVLNTENFDPNDTDAGSYIWALARVAQSYGLQPRGLYVEDGSLHRWTTDEIRATVQQGQPVIVQVVYRGLPGRSDSLYFGDHYVVMTGLLGDNFLYNDPIGGSRANEAPGYDRVISPAQLQRAMHASDSAYAFSAFSLSR